MLSVSTWVTSEGVIRERKRSQDGWKRLWAASRRIGALGRESSGRWNRVDASEELDTEGFSRRTCFPARRALTAHSKWRPLGRGTRTASMLGSARISGAEISHKHATDMSHYSYHRMSS